MKTLYKRAQKKSPVDAKNTAVKMPFFAYRSGSSVMHRIHPLIKLVVLTVLCSVCFLPCKTPLLGTCVLGGCALCAVIAFVLANGNRTTLNVCRYALMLGALVTVFRFVGVSFADSPRISCDACIRIWRFVFTGNTAGATEGIRYTARLFVTALLCELFFETTSLVMLCYALEDAERALIKRFPFMKKLKLSLVVFLSIRFIPHICALWAEVRRASRARCAGAREKARTVQKNGKRERAFFDAFINGFRAGMLFVYARLLELSALFSCLFHDAEETRKAVLSRMQF